MNFRCTACTARLHVPRRWAGSTIECPKCMTRVVVPREPTGAQPVRFEDRSLERRIEAFEAATIAAAMETGSIPGSGSHPRAGSSWGAADRERSGRAMIAIPRGWIPLFAASVAVAIAAAAAAGFYAGWLASQPPAK